MKSLKETPAGVADDYTEKVKALRADEVCDLRNTKYLRPVQPIRNVMIEIIETVQNDLKRSSR